MYWIREAALNAKLLKIFEVVIPLYTLGHMSVDTFGEGLQYFSM